MCSPAASRRFRLPAAAATVLWAGALPVLASILIADPGTPDQDVYNSGRSLIFEERWTQAREVFETLARRHPQSALLDDALYWIAFSLYEESKPAAAYQTLRSLTARFPDSPWSDDARALMVRCAEAALKEEASQEGGRPGRGGASAAEYHRFLEESTRDRSAQVSLLAISSILSREPSKAPELLGRVGSSLEGREGAVVVLDRFFGRERVKVTFDDASAGLAEGNVHVLVRQNGQAVQLSLAEALDVVRGRADGRFPEPVVQEMRNRILEAERSLVTQGEIVAPSPPRGGRGRTSAIVRVVDGEVHYYSNGSESIKIVILKRSAGFNAENVQIFVEEADQIRPIHIADVTGPSRGPSTRGLSTDALEYLRQTLGVIELDLGASGR
jgi:hypothetical protein